MGNSSSGVKADSAEVLSSSLSGSPPHGLPDQFPLDMKRDALGKAQLPDGAGFILCSELDDGFFDGAHGEVHHTIGVPLYSSSEITFDNESDHIGFGAMGQVKKGTCLRKDGGPGLQRKIDVAVKMLHVCEDTAEYHDFVAEVSRLRVLQHPCVVDLVGYMKDPPAIITEYVERGSLHDVLHRKKTALPWESKFRIATDITAGMCYIHEQGFVHRDLKPGNVLVNSVNVRTPVMAKLCDLGTCRLGNEGALMTADVGTFIYQAPEVLAGSTDYNKAVDVYSFGILLCELVMRKCPYDGKSFNFGLQLSRHVIDGGRPTIPDSIPAPVRKLITECWAHNPAERPSFPQIHQRLKNIASQSLRMSFYGRKQMPRRTDDLIVGQQPSDLAEAQQQERMMQLMSKSQGKSKNISNEEGKGSGLLSRRPRTQSCTEKDTVASLRAALEAKTKQYDELVQLMSRCAHCRQVALSDAQRGKSRSSSGTGGGGGGRGEIEGGVAELPRPSKHIRAHSTGMSANQLLVAGQGSPRGERGYNSGPDHSPTHSARQLPGSAHPPSQSARKLPSSPGSAPQLQLSGRRQVPVPPAAKSPSARLFGSGKTRRGSAPSPRIAAVSSTPPPRPPRPLLAAIRSHSTIKKS
eukprot:TRINITY_DN2668_c0_g1_i2.p1 TRINITY_DN2668_c0_g1~~TRINITY_DN2668_c0_g1_i2.p1  ORF type:complete len:635 (+),score=49.56 TRINITY_DN2668_c0_g1_i2:153-2057(+)